MTCKIEVNVGTTNVVTTIPSSSLSNTSITTTEKSEKISKVNFKGWKQRMFFWLTTLGMQRLTSEDPLVPEEGISENQCYMIFEVGRIQTSCARDTF